MNSYIALDWGSTNLRAWWFQDGQCLEQRRSQAGVTQLKGQTFAQQFAAITADWPTREVSVVMAGMVGSNAGWYEAPYLSCPTELSSLANHLTPVDHYGWIVPGLSVSQPDNHNVIRGEETQLLGASDLAPADIYVMPGTHCKWVLTQGKRVLDFRTVMTGELHHLLLHQSLLGTGLPEQIPSMDSFDAGLRHGTEQPSIIAQLFEVRASHVLGTLAREAVSSYLSGLLIGHEIQHMKTRYDVSAKPLTLITDGTIGELYQHALDRAAVPYQVLNSDTAFLHGIRTIADALAK